MMTVRIDEEGKRPIEFDSNATLENTVRAYDHFQTETRYVEFGNAYGSVRVTLEQNASLNRKLLAELAAELVIALQNDEAVETFLVRAAGVMIRQQRGAEGAPAERCSVEIDDSSTLAGRRPCSLLVLPNGRCARGHDRFARLVSYHVPSLNDPTGEV